MHPIGPMTVARRHKPASVALLIAFIGIAHSVGCRAAQESAPAQQAPAAGDSSLQQRIGWVHASCLAIADPKLAPDSPLVIVSLDDVSSVINARVGGVTTSSEACPALLNDRKAANAGKGWTFYEVRLPPATTVDLGIGVTGDVTRVNAGIDVSGDGAADTFTQCATSEGVSFAVWSGEPYQGTPLWAAYYYLGYDTQVTCPS
jgi:hypothetical protein